MEKSWLLKRLEWDSEFFGFGVFSVSVTNFDGDHLTRIVCHSRNSAGCLIYFFVPPQNELANNIVKTNGGVLVDRKMVFRRDIDRVDHTPAAESTTECFSQLDIADLKDLSLQIGELSRFKSDPRIGVKNWEKLYHDWIVNSVSGKICDKVLIVRRDGRIAGILTLRLDEAYVASIGLVGVEQNFRGLGIGKSLIDRALEWCRGNNANSVEVATQGNNFAARRLYESKAFVLKQEINIYHLWT